ncbi:MAG: hypothetical protein U5K31_10440 [Balneolaceae bacterium]|nr:hypothetical protein [Balneolaceae bacterium]
MKWKYLIAWCPVIPITILNSLLREYLFAFLLDDLTTHQLSGVAFILFFGIYVWYILPWLDLGSKRKGVMVGFSWVVLTLSFEFLFGYVVMGYPWPGLFYDFNILDGRLWRVVLIWTFLAPVALYTFRQSNEHL